MAFVGPPARAAPYGQAQSFFSDGVDAGLSAKRAASDERYDEADHLQSYFFTDLSAMDSFNDLSVALRDAGRAPYLLPLVERAVYRLDGTAAAPRIKVGADVLLWWSAKGVYFMIEREGFPAERPA